MDRSQVNEVSFKDREAPGTTQNQVISERLQAKQLLKVTGSPCASKSKETAHSAVSEGLALSIAATRAKAKTTPKKAKLKKQAPQNAEADDHDKQNVFIPPPPPLLPNPSPTAAAPAPAPVLAMAAPLPPPAIKTVKRGRMATFESLLQEDEMAEINLEVEKAAAAASVALAEATAAHGTEGPLPKVFATAHQTVITAGAKEQTGLGPKRAAVHVASIIKHVLRQTPEVMKQQQQANASSSSVHHRNIGRSILIQSKAAKGVAGIETNEDKTTTTHEKVPSNIRKVIKNIFSLAEAQKIDLHSIKEMFDRELKEHRAKTSGPVAPQAAPQAAPQVAEEARVSWIEIPFESPSPPNRYRGAAAHGGPMSSAQASAQIKPFSQERVSGPSSFSPL